MARVAGAARPPRATTIASGRTTPTTPWARRPLPVLGVTWSSAPANTATRLRDRPGDPGLAGYPSEILLRADARTAYRSGERPAVAIFYDDGMRASDLTAASLLPLLVERSEGFDFIAVDVGPQGATDDASNALRSDFGRRAPTVIVFEPDRRRAPRVFRGDRINRADAEIALERALRAPPFREDEQPAPTGEREPAGPVLPGTVDAHVRRLRRGAGEERLAGYPAAIIREVDPRRVFDPGRRPAVIVFYDDASKASDLQAADFLPILVRRQRDIDLVLIDVGVRARWSTFEKEVVHWYYMTTVPTTVVLSPRRKPVKTWYQRVSGEQLERAIEEASRLR